MAGLKQRLQKLGSVIAHGYSLPVVLSLALHGVLLIVVLTGWEQTSQKRIVPPAHIEASLVELPRAKPQPPQKREPAVDQRRAEQQRKAEQKRKEEARQAEARRKEQQKQKELALKREKEKQEKEKQEQARREAEARKAREREQQRQKDAERKKQEEDRRKKQEMLQRLEQERLEQEMQAQAQAEHDQQQVAHYSALIKSLASQYWNRPPSARNNMVAEIRISLSPFGDLIDITLVQSSGNEPFDRSVMQAVRNAAPFSEFRNLDRRIFDEYFRRITIRFRPEDLVR